MQWRKQTLQATMEKEELCDDLWPTYLYKRALARKQRPQHSINMHFQINEENKVWWPKTWKLKSSKTDKSK